MDAASKVCPRCGKKVGVPDWVGGLMVLALVLALAAVWYWYARDWAARHDAQGIPPGAEIVG